MLTFDALAYAKELISVGVPEAQAEVQARTLKKTIDNDLATKADILKLENQIELAKKELSYEFKHDLKELEQRMIIKFGALMIFMLGAFTTLFKFLELIK